MNSSESVNGSSELFHRNRIKYNKKKFTVPDLQYGLWLKVYGRYNTLDVTRPVDSINIVKFKM